MSAEVGSLREQLESTVSTYRHVRAEHARAHSEGRMQRHLENRLAELDARFDRLLEDAEVDDETLRLWREHLYNGAPAPDIPALGPDTRARRLPWRPRWRRDGRAPLWRR